MNKLLIVALIVPTLAYADLGIMDTTSEANAKNAASGLGITQVYDHPNDVGNGQYVIPVQYNRTNSEGNGTEHDANDSKPNDIDYIPLDQMKGAKGDVGTTGVQGQTGKNGKDGKDGRNGKDANVETRMIAGAEVRIASEKYFDVNSFVDYDMTNGKVGFFGMRVTFKPGKSYEERIIEKQQKQIDRLERILQKAVR